MSLINFAQKELELINAFDGKGDFYGGATGKSVMELIECFSKQGHSGMSAPLISSLFVKLADWKPLSHLTFKDDEWHEVGDGMYQNNRCSSVFKDGKDGKPYYLDAITWKYPNGSCVSGTFENITSSQYLKDGKIPKTFYLSVDDNRNIIDRGGLEEVFKVYDKKENTIKS